MDIQDEKLEEQVQEEQVETTEPEEQAEEQEEQVEQSEESQEGESSEEGEAEGQTEEQAEPEERKPSRRESLRIQQLVEKLKTKTQQEQPIKRLDYQEALDADPEVIEQLDSDREAYGKAQYQQGARRAESVLFHTRLEIDAPKIESKYPVLDKTSEQFDPAVADAINNMYLSTVGYDAQTDTVVNTEIRYSDYVESIMELGNAIASEKTTKSVRNIAKQAASTGLRPDGSRAKALDLNKAPQTIS